MLEAVEGNIHQRLCALLDEAVAAGDLALKPGRTLYMHRPAGLKAARLAVAVAADGSARAWKKGLAAGVPMASILFASASVPLIVLPIMLFHQIQLFACTIIAQRYAREDAARPKDEPQAGTA